MVDEFRQLLIDAAPLIRNCQSVYRVDEPTWVVTIDGMAAITFWVDENLDRVVMSTSVGRPSKELRGSTCEVLMVFNGLWRENGGQRFALEEPDGDIEQLLDLKVTGLSVEKLVQLVDEFAQRSHDWRELIETHGGLDAEEHRESLTPLLGQGIRV